WSTLAHHDPVYGLVKTFLSRSSPGKSNNMPNDIQYIYLRNATVCKLVGGNAAQANWEDLHLIISGRETTTALANFGSHQPIDTEVTEATDSEPAVMQACKRSAAYVKTMCVLYIIDSLNCVVNNKENYKFGLGLEGLRTGLLGQL
ncbi:hypothetical protein pdam_00011904, partial [Pocillopora damicornis]